MISDEIRDGIKAKCDIQVAKNNSRKKGKNTRIKKIEAPAHREAYDHTNT